jgi:hypothetical protein
MNNELSIADLDTVHGGVARPAIGPHFAQNDGLSWFRNVGTAISGVFKAIFG